MGGGLCWEKLGHLPGFFIHCSFNRDMLSWWPVDIISFRPQTCLVGLRKLKEFA